MKYILLTSVGISLTLLFGVPSDAAPTIKLRTVSQISNETNHTFFRWSDGTYFHLPQSFSLSNGSETETSAIFSKNDIFLTTHNRLGSFEPSIDNIANEYTNLTFHSFAESTMDLPEPRRKVMASPIGKRNIAASGREISYSGKPSLSSLYRGNATLSTGEDRDYLLYVQVRNNRTLLALFLYPNSYSNRKSSEYAVQKLAKTLNML